MARIKTVFSSNSQVCHVWAQQKQEHGRAGNIFFEGDTIFSYGHHFPMGRIHTLKNGKKVALITNRGYSSSTGQHKGDAYHACTGLMPVFHSDDINSLKVASKNADDNARKCIVDALKKVKVSHTDLVKWKLERINGLFDEANQLRKLIGKKPIKFSNKDKAKIKAHFEKRFKRYQELNTPEMREKREQERVKRQLANERKEIEKQQELIQKFRNGELSSLPYSVKLTHELLQVKGDTVRTSRGAEVPLCQAMLLYKAIEAGKSVLGTEVGSFTVVKVDTLPNGDKAVKIGCHNILLSEARQVLGEVK